MYILHIKIVLNNNLYHTAFRKAGEPAERGAVEIAICQLNAYLKSLKS